MFEKGLNISFVSSNILKYFESSKQISTKCCLFLSPSYQRCAPVVSIKIVLTLLSFQEVPKNSLSQKQIAASNVYNYLQGDISLAYLSTWHMSCSTI